MASYTIRRLIQAIPIVIGISVISFAIVYLTPGNFVDKFRTGRVSEATIQNLIHVYGLDQPLPVQFWKWFTNFWTFPVNNLAWGFSFTDGQPVRDLIFARIPATLLLMGTSLLVTIVLAIPIGIMQAVKQYSWADKIITTLETIGYAMPTFWLGLILKQLFSVQLKLFPLYGMQTLGKHGDIPDILAHLVLPVTTLAVIQVAGWSRYMRASMLEVMRQDFIRTARSKGLASSQVIRKHALRNALIPIVTLLGLTIPSLLSGAAITETVFSWPGLGYLGVTSVIERDYPVVLAVVMIGGVMVILGNLLADIAYAVVDPRIHY
ncbi:MAG TPA: ABC transporter permease [Candidatus Limnocylindrales bacterium]|nr:ABC transporter permease [Candidatus Limnocylindrales bacterium]